LNHKPLKVLASLVGTSTHGCVTAFFSLAHALSSLSGKLNVQGSLVLTENEVVEAVCLYLIGSDYEIHQKLTTTQTGVDIVATNALGTKCYVEAKGATSSKRESSKFGKEFNKSQVKVHIGVALVAAFKVISENPTSESMIALPNNINHKSLIENIRQPIKRSGIGVLLVSDSGLVEKYI
jgi:hypothetical protein